jgi:hypothetical protein
MVDDNQLLALLDAILKTPTEEGRLVLLRGLVKHERADAIAEMFELGRTFARWVMR